MNKVTVLCITYNHEKYIKQALDGFVMQKTNFPFEVIIGDDGSTDNNQNIIKEYAQKYPNIIKPILREKNITAFENFLDIAKRVNSEYVAICEGDDFWTNENKLQKQVDFLDTNLDHSLCFHSVKVFYENGEMPPYIFPEEHIQIHPNVTSLNIVDLLTVNFIQTNSVMYRWIFNDKYPFHDVFPRNIQPGDYFMHLLHAQRGRIGFIREVMASYRRHPEGLWWNSTTNTEQHFVNYGVKELRFYMECEKVFPEYKMVKGNFNIKHASELFSFYLQRQDFVNMQQVLELCPEILSPEILANQ